MTRISFALVAALAVGCAGKSDAPTDDLDVRMEAGPASPADDEDKITYANVVPVKKPEPGAKLPPTAVVDWQAFFRPPPTKEQRSLLEAKLAKWKDTEDADQLVDKGRAELAAARPVAAETSFRKALRLKPRHAEAMLELASLALRKRAINDAFDLLERVNERIKTSDDLTQSFVFRYRYTLAMAYIARDERDKGHKILSDLIGLDKSFAPAYVALATSYLSSGKENIAEFVAKRGLDRTQNHPPLLNVLGVVALRQRQHEAARQWFDRAIEASPSFVPALVNRAALSARGLEHEAAEQDLLAALSHDPYHVDALVALGVVQKKLGNLSGARAAFLKALDVAPDDAHVRFNLGVLYADDLKRPGEAVRFFTEVIQTEAASGEMKGLARSYLQGLKPGTSEH